MTPGEKTILWCIIVFLCGGYLLWVAPSLQKELLWLGGLWGFLLFGTRSWQRWLESRTPGRGRELALLCIFVLNVFGLYGLMVPLQLYGLGAAYMIAFVILMIAVRGGLEILRYLLWTRHRK